MQTFSTRRQSLATKKKQEKQSIKKLQEKGAKNMAKAAKKKTPHKEYSLADLSPELIEKLGLGHQEENSVSEYAAELDFDPDDSVSLPWDQ